MWRFALPLVVLAALLAFFWRGLFLHPSVVASPLIGKSAPAFSLPSLKTPQRKLTRADLKGQVSLLNVWATWCFACREEHKTLLGFARRGIVPVYGLDYKDDRSDALAWLKKEGNPYRASAFDQHGNAAIDWGVYGAPETFLVDADGIIRYKYIGPLTEQVIQQDLLPRIRKWKRARQ